MSSDVPRTAMILGAGLGKRMRPLTDHMPKPMVQVNGKPLIDHVLEKLMQADVQTAIVNVHYKADVLEQHLKQRTDPPSVIISDERAALLDTGGGVIKALPLLGSEPFFHMNADTIWIDRVGTSNLREMAAQFNADAMDGLLLLAQSDTSMGYDGRGDFFRNGRTGHLRRREHFQKKAPFVYAGAAILHPRLFATAPEGAFSLNVLFDRALAAKRLYGFVLSGQWMHVGTPEAVEEATQHIHQHLQLRQTFDRL